MGEWIPLETYRLKTITLETTFYLFLLQATMSESLGKTSDTIEKNDSLPFLLLVHWASSFVAKWHFFPVVFLKKKQKAKFCAAYWYRSRIRLGFALYILQSIAQAESADCEA